MHDIFRYQSDRTHRIYSMRRYVIEGRMLMLALMEVIEKPGIWIWEMQHAQMQKGWKNKW